MLIQTIISIYSKILSDIKQVIDKWKYDLKYEIDCCFNKMVKDINRLYQMPNLIKKTIA